MSEITRKNRKKPSEFSRLLRPPCEPWENPLDCHIRWAIGEYAKHPVPEELAREVMEKIRLEKLAKQGQ